jgi:hypothetical protein
MRTNNGDPFVRKRKDSPGANQTQKTRHCIRVSSFGRQQTLDLKPKLIARTNWEKEPLVQI